MVEVPEISPFELREALSSYSPPKVLDVRELEELANGTLPNVVHIPLHELGDRVGELDPDDDWVVVCRSGSRSAKAVALMMENGFAKVWNLIGGMNGYAHAVDTSINVY